MIYRSPTADDITSLMEMYGCSESVTLNVIRQLDMVKMFLKFKSYSRVTVAFENEYQFFENHVLQDEVPFVDFYNGLLDRLEIKGALEPTVEEENLDEVRSLANQVQRMKIEVEIEVSDFEEESCSGIEESRIDID